MKPNFLENLTTPALLLNKDILVKNCNHMQKRISSSGLSLRSHMKTAKSIDVYDIATQSGFKGITVSTLAEANYFSSNGVTDIIYAVGIVPSKINQIAEIQANGCDLKLITDSLSIIAELNQAAIDFNLKLKLLIEIDSGGARGGVLAGSDDLIRLGGAIQQASNIDFTGLITHAGHCYHCRSIEQIKVIAEDERTAVTSAAARLNSQLGLHSKIISTGSTPTAMYAESFEGLTETRPGVYMFGDIDQFFIGSCAIDDIAVSVLTTVIGHNRQANRILIDAGGLALSKDTSASEFSRVTGYGWICSVTGKHIDDLYVESVHQEHGLIASSNCGELHYERYPVGSKLRILPIHSCMTVAAYDNYQVHDNQNNLIDQWTRVNRW